jgi:hypothetical protein
MDNEPFASVKCRVQNYSHRNAARTDKVPANYRKDRLSALGQLANSLYLEREQRTIQTETQIEKLC